MTLRRLWLLIGTIWAFAGILLGGALIKITDDLHDVTSSMKLANQSVYLSEELEIALLRHNRDRFLFSITQNDRFEAESIASRAELVQLAKLVEQNISFPEDGAQVVVVQDAIREYLKTRNTVEEKNLSPLEEYLSASPLLEEAYDALEKLVALNQNQINLKTKRAERDNLLADYMGYATITFFILSLLMMGFIGSRILYHPLRALARSIGEYINNRQTQVPLNKGVKEIQIIAEAFQNLTHDLQRNKDTQLRFLASVAHDLKNPISAIKMSADVLRPGEATSDKERNEIIDIISRQSNMLERLVSDLLDASRIEAGKLDLRLQKVNLSQLVKDAYVLFNNSSMSHDVSLSLPTQDIWCCCDRDRIGQVLNNLLSNAIKYSPHGGAIIVEVMQEDDWAHVSISDEGIGIPKHEENNIFEPFRRAAATKDTIPGVGLGLAVSKKIVENHGGRIRVEHRHPKGTIFYIDIPTKSKANVIQFTVLSDGHSEKGRAILDV